MKKSIYILVLSFGVFFSACKDNPSESETVDIDISDTNFDIPDWTETTHGKSAAPDFSIVFPDDRVNRLDIVISDNNWDAMLTDMEQNYGSFGSSGGRPVMSSSDSDPVYVPCSVFF